MERTIAFANDTNGTIRFSNLSSVTLTISVVYNAAGFTDNTLTFTVSSILHGNSIQCDQDSTNFYLSSKNPNH